MCVMQSLSPVLQAIVHAARLAGESLERDLARIAEVSVVEKGPADFVSSADLRSQDILRRELSLSLPDHALVLEEGDATNVAGAAKRVYVDPLDGTTNFLHGIPHFAVSIGVEVDGEVVAGVVLDVAKGETFVAEKGRGAWLGDRALHVPPAKALARAVVGTGIPHRGGIGHDAYVRALANVMREVAGVRRFGAAALDLAYVAAGRLEAFFERGLKPWDVAAGALLVREAGGRVSRCDGSATAVDAGDVLASCGDEVHAALVTMLAPLSLP
jgi:myo-inositol-1(or 4)-monophosphatase